MTLLKFELAPHELQFTCGSEYPYDNSEELVQVRDRTAAGNLRVEGYGVTIKRRTLLFAHMPKVDYDSLLNWYYNVADGALNAFTITDEFGLQEEVRIVAGTLDFTERYTDTSSGSLLIEVIN